MNILKPIRYLYNKIYYSIHEKKKYGCKYLFVNNNSNELLIIFSGFPSHKPVYNYVRSLNGLSIDKLYILDNWGYKGSYYWMENGSSKPEQCVKSLIDSIIKKKQYKKVYTGGTSKGGTCALYYGLHFNVDKIIAGANQYFVGSYLNVKEYQRILKGMLGENVAPKDIDTLNNKLSNMINESSKSFTGSIYLQFSKKEHTYPEHIFYLIKKLEYHKYNLFIKEESFSNHNDIGKYFPNYLITILKQNE